MTERGWTLGPKALTAPVRPRGGGRGRGGIAAIARQALRTRRGAIGLTLVAIVVLFAVIGPFVAPHPPNALSTIPLSGPSGHAWLGGDFLGRDVWSRLLAGGWALLLLAVLATVLGVAAGTAIGVTAGLLQGKWDSVLMRCVDIGLAFPQIVFALLLVSVAGARPWLVVVAVGISHTPQVARVVRAATLDVSEQDYVKVAESNGVSRWRVMMFEIVPNLVSVLMVELGLRLTFSITLIAGLTFIGFGLRPPAPNWGVMINENRIGLTLNPWGVLAPIALIAILTIGMNMLTDAFASAAIGVDRAGDLTLESSPFAAETVVP
jgi:peptide/nickel transport system permease protein